MVIYKQSFEKTKERLIKGLIFLFFSKCKYDIFAVCIMLFCGCSYAQSSDNWNVEGAHGVLNIKGILTEGACRLDMKSAYQQVFLGVTPTGKLLHPGNRGVPVAVNIFLRDCIRSGGMQQDTRKFNKTYDRLQPVVSVRFLGLTDDYNSKLLKVHGASGFGLRILDSDKKDVRIGNTSSPQYLMPEDNILTYYILPERTSAPLIVGAYHTIADFGMSYD